MKNRAVAALTIATLWSSQSLAQSGAPLSDTDWSKEAENPLTRHITLPLRYEAEFQDGADKLTKSTFEIDQAVVPFQLNDDWALITRTKLPAEVLPAKSLGDPWVDGLSNGYTTFFLSPEHGTGFYWGAGPVLYYPTATNSALGVNKWGSGPSVAFLVQKSSPWVFGGVVNNIWSFGGPPAAVTEPTSYCSIRSSAIISRMDGRWARRRISRRTGSRAGASGPSRLAAASVRSFGWANSR